MKRMIKRVLLLLFLLLALTACAVRGQQPESAGEDFSELNWEGGLPLSYAEQFTVERCGSYRLISVQDEGRFLLVPKDEDIPARLPDDVSVLREPLERTYLVSTSAMDLIRRADALSYVRFSGTMQENWYIDEVKRAMEKEDIIYAGKYNAPDYELLLGEGCDLTVENTMILHNPEVKEKLEELDIPVLVEKSSYEPDPLGRLEWIKLYGVLFGKEKEAQDFFDKEIKKVQPVLYSEDTGLTAAFFSVSSDGSITVRKSGDYISKMIRMAGGEYVFSDLGGEKENALSTMRMQMEDFYAGAKDADVIIYNSAIEEELKSVDDLVGKNALFSDFKAVKEGNVFCAGKNFFQEASGSCDFIKELNQVFESVSGNQETALENMRFLKKLR